MIDLSELSSANAGNIRVITISASLSQPIHERGLGFGASDLRIDYRFRFSPLRLDRGFATT
jgi:hypothetical protein